MDEGSREALSRSLRVCVPEVAAFLQVGKQPTWGGSTIRRWWRELLPVSRAAQHHVDVGIRGAKR
jgi:hypothetical protein